MQKANGSSSILNKVPPHDYESEQAVLACLMIEENSLDKIMGIIMGSDFYDPRNTIVFEAIVNLYSSSRPYDLTMVASALTNSKQIGQVGGIDYLVELTRIIPNASNIEQYARNVKSKSKLRELIEASSSIYNIAYEVSMDITKEAVDAIDISGQIIMELSKDGSHKDPKPISMLINDVYADLHELYARKEEMTGVPSGFYDLDKMTNGLQPGAFIIIAGRPAMGKTSFALNIAQNAALKGKTAVIFSLEMSSSQLLQRMISYESRIPGSKLQKGTFDENEWQKLADIGDNLAGLNIFIDDTSSISLMEIRSKCRRLKTSKEHGLDLVVIDYLQLMENKRIESREQQIAEISRNLKGLARELEIPVIALSQLNRSVESRSDKRPMPSDLRESGSIEQDADLIMFIYRDEVYNENTADKGVAEIIIGKHRAGPTGTVRLGFQNECTRFYNLDRSGYLSR